METKVNEDNLEYVIGALLLMPIYIIVLLILKLPVMVPVELPSLNIDVGTSILILMSIYLPAVIGMLLCYKNYGYKINKPLRICFWVLLSISIYLFCLNCYVDNVSKECYTYWLIISAILKIFEFILYLKVVDSKKAIIFVFIYVNFFIFD